jgi:hypothetical protein
MAVDILDIKEVDDAKSSVLHFVLWPKQWQTFALDLSGYKWHELRFDKSKMKRIPKRQGVYTFLIKPSIAKHPACSYLMYVGRTTDQDLRIRFGQYIQEQEGHRKSRAKVEYMLRKYRDYLFFAYIPLDSGLSPEVLEERLLLAYIPPVNDEDALPAEVRRIRKAAGL